MTARHTPPASPAAPGLLIVARDQPELYRDLQQLFADSPRAVVILDRRRADRRRHALAVPVDRRRMERRSPVHIEDDLRQRNYILVRPHTRRPQD
jgi:hypothetical protein